MRRTLYSPGFGRLASLVILAPLALALACGPKADDGPRRTTPPPRAGTGTSDPS